MTYATTSAALCVCGHAQSSHIDRDPDTNNEFCWAASCACAVFTLAPEDRRLWTCPLCTTSVVAEQAPPGWLVVEPFTRVASCASCRPILADREARARRCACGHPRWMHATLGERVLCLSAACDCPQFGPAA